MQTRNVPNIEPRYWCAILVASMCGANAGDFAARYLHLGHALGLAPLLAIFLAVVWGESRSTRPTELYYWLAIIVLRTAATNLADLGTHDLKLNYAIIEAGLTALLVALVAFDRSTDQRAGNVPNTNMAYWVAMLTAGVLGTASGDWVADETGLGVGWGSLVLLAVFAALLSVAYKFGRMNKAWYWASIVAARTAGTTMGDFLASRHGANLGLPVSLICTSVLLALIIMAWKRGARPATAAA